MARPTRLEIAGGWYHVVNRGIERRAIFRAEGNYEHFLELLAKAVARFGVRVHGYVLMGNHYHLQLETPQANLSKAMQWLNAAYSIWFNRKYGRVGPLFQGRFKAILHDRRTHGLVINRYMNLNPVRVKGLGGHEGRGEVNKELEANGMQKLLKGDWREQHAVRQSAKGALSWEAITAAVSKVWDGDWQKISTRHGSSAKAAALHLARNHSDQSLRELGALAGGMQYPP